MIHEVENEVFFLAEFDETMAGRLRCHRLHSAFDLWLLYGIMQLSPLVFPCRSIAKDFA